MDANAIIMIATTLSGVAGGFWSGKRSGNGAVTTALETVQLIQFQVETLTHEGVEKDHKISELQGKVEVLEGLITQRADVEGVRGVVDRIAAKVGA
ncbi:MAG TPA: hypothetical protein VIY48_19275 [Candidatus Paceibacterota bacterium]